MPTSTGSIRKGLKSGLAVATFFTLLVTAQRILLGPHAFERVGMSWLEIVGVYYVAFSVGGCAYGALLPFKRRYIVAAMMAGILLVLPLYLAMGFLIGVGLNKAPSVGVAVAVGVVAALLVGIPLGLRDWGGPEEGEEGHGAAARPDP